MKFSEFDIKSCLIKAVEAMGYEDTTDIQERVIPEALKGGDVIAQAPTGTGKTCAFGLPILNNIIESDATVQALIISPTRELANQITNDFKNYAKYLEGVRIVSVYGGEDITKQITQLKRRPQIIVSTPGRLMDHLERHTIKLDNVKTLVLDEADEMLNMGFREDIDAILKQVNNEHQTMLFSATYSDEIRKICEEYLHDPVQIRTTADTITVDTVDQYYCLVKENDKIELMSRLIDVNDFNIMMVFCNTKRAVDEVTSGLMQRGYVVEGLHGDMKQMQRDRTMARFKDGLVNILVCSDVAARGLDVSGVDCVFNYDVPEDEEYYVHRIGRTGRAKAKGLAITLVTPDEKYRLRSIIAYSKATINKLDIPGLNKVLRVRINRVINKATTLEIDKDSKDYKMVNDEIHNNIVNMGLNPYDVINGLILMQLNELKEIEVIKEEHDRRKTASGDVRVFINLGRNDGMSVRDLLNLVSVKAGIKRDDINNAELHDDFSFFEVSKKKIDGVLYAFNKVKLGPKRIVVEEAKARPGSGKSSSRNSSKNSSKNSSRGGSSKSSTSRRDDKNRNNKNTSREKQSGRGTSKTSSSRQKSKRS